MRHKMPTIIDYRVIQTDTRLGIINNVNKAISDGWQPLGGIAVDEDGHYLQAMVNYENEGVQT